MTAFQLVAARDAVSSVPLMLDEQGIGTSAVGDVAPASLAGVASDGRPLGTLFEQASTSWAFDLMVATQLQDVARAAASVRIAATPDASGYIRMLNPPSCSRCTVLAGRFYRWNKGFDRHPRCDCRHVPTSDAQMAREMGLIDNPNEYFHQLPTAEQDRIFTKAGAQAIRDGADISQVVNARRGMTTAARGTSGRRMLVPERVGGRDVFVTREGTTKRGQASRARTGRNMSARLMPESIYEIAEDRADAIRMLKLHGYLI